MEIRFEGNVGKDAQLRKVNNGGREDFVLDIWVAENIIKRGGEAEKTAITRWHKVTLWRKYAETMAPYLKQGRHIMVEGTAKANFYTTKDGRVVPYIDVQAEKIRFMDGKRPEDDVPPETAETAPVEVEEEIDTPW